MKHFGQTTRAATGTPTPRHTRWRTWIAAAASTILVLLVGLLTPPQAHAATSRTIKGTVACQVGNQVVGVWVSSSNGGSKFASFTRRSGAGWIADYEATVITSQSTTTIRLDVGCGGTSTTWKTNNSTPDISVSGSTTRSALCKEAEGSRARRCSWWGDTVLIGMPFTGVWDKFGLSHPSQHSAGVHDWATDIYAASGTDTRPRFYGPRGKTLSVSTGPGHLDPTGVSTVGRYASAKVTLGGVALGYVRYGHLANVPSSISSNGTFVGDLKRWPYNSSYWQVTNEGGVHTHIGVYNYSGWSCFWPRTSGSQYEDGRLIGKIGKTNATAAKGRCA